MGIVSCSSMSFSCTDLSHLGMSYLTVFFHGWGSSFNEFLSDNLVFALYSCILDFATASIIVAFGDFDCFAFSRELIGVAIG